MANSFLCRSIIATFMLAFLCTSNYDLVTGLLRTWPQNTEAVIGKTVRLNCSTTDPYLVNWEHVKCGHSSKAFIYIGGEIIDPYHERFRIKGTKEEGQYDLEIRSVQLEDSGKYRCIDREGQGMKREAELIVLGSQPLCYCHEFVGKNSCGIKEQDDMYVTCEVSYSGNSIPKFSCDSQTVVDKAEEGSGTIKYVLIFKADPDMTRSVHACYTSISNISSAGFYSNVTYARAQQNDLTIESPGRVTCAVNSSKICDYRWVRVDAINKTVSFDQTLYISEEGSYVCEADCPLAGGRNCRIQPVTVKFQLKSNEGVNEQSTSITIGVVTAGCVILILAVVLLIVCIIKRKTSVPACSTVNRSEIQRLRNKRKVEDKEAKVISKSTIAE